MPTKEEVLSTLKPKLSRLKELGEGVKVSRVLGARVLVKTVVAKTELDEVENRGLIVLPESVKAEYTPLPSTGIVLGVGPEVTNGLAEGDMILFPRVAGMDFQIAHQDLRIIHANEILAVLTDTDTSVVEVKSVPESAT